MRKIFFVLAFTVISSLFVFQSSSCPAHAAPKPWDSGYDMGSEFIKALESDEPNLWNWMGNLWMGGLETVYVVVNGSRSTSSSSPSSTRPTRFAGLVGLTESALGSVYQAQTPFATTIYLASLSPVKPVYAATGTYHLTFILELWKICRNIAYLVMIIILVVLGFMIMFRKKLDPRTEITLISALPKVVVVLLLITFSYAIAGLMFDIASVSKGLINGVLGSLNLFGIAPAALPGGFPRPFAFYDIFNEFGMGSFADALRGRIPGVIPGVPLIGDLGAGTIFGIVFGMAMLSVMIKLLAELIKYFAQWFFLTIIGPFLLAVGALPNMAEVISWWLGRLFVSVIVFPATYAVLNVAFYIKYVLVVTAPVVTTLPPSDFFGIPTAGFASQSEFIGMIICWGLVLASASLPGAIDNLVSGEIGRRVEGVDITQAARRIPIIGGLFG